VSGRRHFGNVRKLPSGRYQANYFHEGKRYTAPDTFEAKADANAYLSTAETDIRRGGWLDPDRALIHFSTVAAQWLAAGTTKRQTSVDRDQSIITNHLKPLFGERSIGSIKPANVQSAVDQWTATYTPSTVQRHFACLRAICAYAEASEMILRSPCRGIRLPKIRLVDRPVLTPKDLERLGDKLGTEQGVFMWCAAVLGLRWAEVAGITVDRLNLLAGSITIDRQMNRSGELVTPKSEAGSRSLACPAWLVDDFAAVLALRGLSAADGDALVFVNGDGGPLAYTNWRRRTWLTACEKASLPDLRFHDLRSLNATALVASGADVKTAQTRLGHSSSRVTLDIYARATGKADRKAANAVGTFLRPTRTQRARQESKTKKASR
jgi:integrase